MTMVVAVLLFTAVQAFGVYLPQLKVPKSLRNRQPAGFEALFPRYIFFQSGHAELSIAPVRSTQGVATIVRFGGVPAVLQPDTLQRIRAFEGRQNTADFAELSDLRPGKTVLVTTVDVSELAREVEASYSRGSSLPITSQIPTIS